MKPLVSILIPAYNAQQWIAESIQSANAQTWPRKEIIVVDDGSADRTAEVARGFAAKNVKVLSTANQGAAAARNHAYVHAQGDYIQWLDADDVLAPDKIERQLGALGAEHGRRVLLSCPMGLFFYAIKRARFVETPLWRDLSPVEWLLRKLGQNLRMSIHTWLTSRELAEAAGPWDNRLQFDDDGEYFSRVLLASEGTRFVREARAFTRKIPSSTRVSCIGKSKEKQDSLLVSLKLHMHYLVSLEESERVREACLAYLQTWYDALSPNRSEVLAEFQVLAAEFGGRLQPVRLRSKYAWIEPVLGLSTAKWTQTVLPAIKTSWLSRWDKTLHSLECRQGSTKSNSQGPKRGRKAMAFLQQIITWLSSQDTDSTIIRTKHSIGSLLRKVFPGWPGAGGLLLKARIVARCQVARCEVMGCTFYVDVRDKLISRRLLGCIPDSRVYEPQETEFIKSRLREGMTFVDIGANIGWFTILAAKAVGPAGKVISFEPEPANFRLLRRNISANALHNVLANNLAVVEQPKTLKLYLSSYNFGDHRIFDSDDDSVQNAGRREHVLTVGGVSLDDYLDGKRERIDVIKMDVQGAEYSVLQGMKQTLTANHRIVLLTEFWPAGMRMNNTRPEAYLEELRTLGFTIYELSPDGSPVPVPDDILGRLHERRDYANLVCYRDAALRTGTNRSGAEVDLPT